MDIRRGDLLKLRAFGNREIVRRFVGLKRDRVLVCSEEEFQAAEREKRKPECIAFLRSDVIPAGKSRRVNG